jgi:hypothetical protein
MDPQLDRRRAWTTHGDVQRLLALDCGGSELAAPRARDRRDVYLREGSRRAARLDEDVMARPERLGEHAWPLSFTLLRGREADRLCRTTARPRVGYVGSDAAILEELARRLTGDPDVDESEIECEVCDGEVMLRGSVPDRVARRSAEYLAETIPGVREVISALRLRSDPQSNGPTESGGGSETSSSVWKPTTECASSTAAFISDGSGRSH